ncbi:MAG: hypothetical protein ACR2FH_11205, partial [Caulobacteraceae bacterium]
LTVTRTASGGAGGSSNGGGAGKGGAAVASRTFDDTKNATRSFTLSAASNANGGAGGAGAGVTNGAAGGAATVSLTLTGAHGVIAASTATGGAGGAASGAGVIGAGGSAIATTVATAGGSLNASAVAHGGVGATAVGSATATTTATGAFGTLLAAASTGPASGQLIQSLSTSAAGMVDGTSTDTAQTAVGGKAAAFDSISQAVALETGAPNAASTSAVLSANKAIANAFGGSPVFFAIGELGGGYSSGGTIAQTTTVSLDESVDLTKLGARNDLVVGLYNGTAVGSGFTAMTFDLFADGIDVIHQSFTSAAAATTFFTNHAFDLGSLAGGKLGANTLTLHAVMSITTNAAGSGFYGDLIVGDPPAKRSPSLALHPFIQAMAGFGAEAEAGAALAAGPAMGRFSHGMLIAPKTA